MTVDDRVIQVEEYQSLRNEIDGNQRDGIKILEVALVLTAALFAVATSQYVDAGWRWLVFLTPWLILLPLVILMAQRVRQTFKIGRYIQTCLEPDLGLNWERYHARKRVEEKEEKERMIPTFLVTSAAPLMIIQTVAVSLAMFSYNFNLVAPPNPIAASDIAAFAYNGLWKFAIFAAFLISMAYEYDVVKRANNPDEYAAVDENYCREQKEPDTLDEQKSKSDTEYKDENASK